MSFFDDYFSYVGNTESPRIFHRWTAISIVGALLSRNVYFPLGQLKIYPNQFILLTGSPGARKGTALNLGIKLLEELGYKYFAPSAAAKEALWEWMADQSTSDEVDEWIDDVIEPEGNKDFVSQMYYAQDEVVDFLGTNDKDLMSNLTALWDCPKQYHHAKTRAKSITVYNPTLNILSGITPGGIAESFGSFASSGGFFSRILFIFSSPSHNKIAYPSSHNKEAFDNLIFRLGKISELEGRMNFSQTSAVGKLIQEIYHNTPGIQDSRFTYYAQRRYTHLLKIIICLAAMDLTLTPTVDHVILANTLLAVAEFQMPSALGEYGKAKHADVSNRVVEMIAASPNPLTSGVIWKSVSRDLEKQGMLTDILSNLVSAERIQKANEPGKVSYIINRRNQAKWKSHLVDYNLLHPDEHYEDTGHISSIGALS